MLKAFLRNTPACKSNAALVQVRHVRQTARPTLKFTGLTHWAKIQSSLVSNYLCTIQVKKVSRE